MSREMKKNNNSETGECMDTDEVTVKKEIITAELELQEESFDFTDIEIYEA